MNNGAKTVGAVASLVGVTVRTLHHWDEIGLAGPSERTAAGYRLYTAADVARIHRVLVYRELGVSLDALMSQTTAPLLTVSPGVTFNPVMVPALCAVSGCSIFIASITTTVSPSATDWPSAATSLTTVPCIGETSESPLTAAAPPPPLREARFLFPPGLPPLFPAAGAAATPREAGRTTSMRLPPTSTVTVSRSAVSAVPT